MNEHTKQQRQFWIILIIIFLGFLGISMPYLIFPGLFLNPSYSFLPADWNESSRVIFLGITLAAYPLGQFLGSPILGSLSDDYGRKRILSGSLVISAICYLLSGLAIGWQLLWLLIVSRFLAGLMEGNIAIARAMAADLNTLSKHKTFGKINAVASTAFLLGPFLGGLLTDKEVWEILTTSTPFYCICVLFIGLSGLTTQMSHKMANNAIEIRTFWQRINLLSRLSFLFSNQRLKFLIITSTCFTLAVDIYYEFGPVYLTIKWGLGPAQLIIYNSAICLALVAGNGFLPAFLEKRASPRWTVICSIASFTLILIGVTFTESTLLMLVFFALSGLAIGIATTFITVKISNSVSDAIQGEVLGVQISLRVLGDAIICLIGGGLLIISSKIILIIASIISALALIYYCNFNNKN